MSNPPVLIPPQKGMPFKLYLSADEKAIGLVFKLYLSADEKAIGLVLVQEFDGKERAIFYLSRKLLDAETMYSPVERLRLCLYVTAQGPKTALVHLI